MWRQSYALIHGSTQAPSELWTVARDLWTLKLSTLLNRLEDQPQATSEEDDTDPAVNEESSGTEPSQPQQRPKNNLSPKLWDTVSLVYLAALLIRHPISLSTIYELIRSEGIPFIRAVRFVPYEITSHLPSEYQLALDTISIPQRDELQKAAYRLISSFASTFDMDIPPLNWKILLYKWIVELGLPLEVYSTFKSLAKILDCDFKYQVPNQTLSNQSTEPTRTFRRTPIAMPELKIMSLIIVATKLLFPFRNSGPPISNSNSPTQNSNPQLSGSLPEIPTNPLTDLSLNWPAWQHLHKTHTHPLTGPQKHIETTDKDVSKMSPEELDDYMSWYQRTFTTPDSILRQKKTDLEMSILGMFPMPDLPSATGTGTGTSAGAYDAKESLCAQIQTSALRYAPTSTSTSNSSTYPIFPSVDALTSSNQFFDDDLENNPIVYFHELAARVACTDLKGLVRAVRYTEGKIEAWIDRRRREVEMEVEVEEGEDDV